MNLTFLRSTVAAYVFAFLAIAGLFTAVGLTANKHIVPQQGPKGQLVTDRLPEIINKTTNLEISSSQISDRGKSNARAVFKVANRTGKPVTSFTLTFGSVSVGRDGGLDSDEPVTVIEPFGTATIEIPVGNLVREEPITLAAVTFADGTEDGQDVVLEMVHSQRAEAKAKRDARKVPHNEILPHEVFDPHHIRYLMLPHILLFETADCLCRVH